MDQFADFLQAVGYHFALVQPLLPMYLHLILSALFPIYAGAHASLSRPSSAAKPPKRKIAEDEDDEPEDHVQKMEGLSPSDAILLPLFAGATLAGLYFLIKWLEDPAVLNKILNWYFSIFGVLSVARLITDTMGNVSSFIFPSLYASNGEIWEIDGKDRKAKPISTSNQTRLSPLPGFLSKLPLPELIKDFLWTLKELPSQQIRIRAHIRNVLSAHFKIGPQGLSSIVVALVAQAYFNLVGKPWWLTNLLGFSLAYSALQIMSPTTSWTGTLVLSALFFYDIYFVFFTPLMVTVATQLDIPAKLLFPRPSRPGEDPTKQRMSILGLGDVVLPGMMIGFALRFDLYLFYLRKQTRQEIQEPVEIDEIANAPPSKNKGENYKMLKDRWYPTKGGWGERFWASRQAIVTSEKFHGTTFPKTYFHASLIGYIMGMIITLGVMQVFGHAQPALLYLVPGVLGALWGTALIKGEFKTLWAYSEADGDEESKEKNENEKAGKGKKVEGSKWNDWKSIFFHASTAKKSDSQVQKKANGETTSNKSEISEKVSKTEDQESETGKPSPRFRRDKTSELIFLSINLPTAVPAAAVPTEIDTTPSSPSPKKNKKPGRPHSRRSNTNLVDMDDEAAEASHEQTRQPRSTRSKDKGAQNDDDEEVAEGERKAVDEGWKRSARSRRKTYIDENDLQGDTY